MFSSTEQELIDLLKSGDRLCKLPRTGRTPEFRKFYISRDETALCWDSERKSQDKAKIRFADVKQVVIGQQTPLFQKPKNRQFVEQFASQSFSLICKDRTVDLICEDPMQTFTWIKGLELLTKANQHKTETTDAPQISLQMATARHSVGSAAEGHQKHEVTRSRSKTAEQRIKSFFPKFHLSFRSDNSETSMLRPDRHNSLPSVPVSARGSSHPRSPSSDLTAIKSRLDQLLENDEQERQKIRSEKKELVTSSEDARLFDFVAVVKLQEKENKKYMEPFISYSFPPSNIQKKENMNLMLSIPSFCFPDIDSLHPIDSLKSTTYSFVLTDIDGSRRHGYCRRMLPPGTGSRWPETYCIISSHPCFSLFSDILDQVEKRQAVNSVSVFSFLKSILANPFPKPGAVISVKAQDLKTGEFQELKLSRPQASDPILEYIDFSPLFSRMSTANILSLFLSLLLERRCIFISSDITVLSSVTHACMAMIYPFTWQHVFIPVLPKSLLDYVCSPVPFIVGVLASHRGIVDTMPMEEVVFIDLDKDKVIGGDDSKQLPSNSIAKKLDSIKKQSGRSKSDNNKDIADTFLEFFLSHFGDYRKCMNEISDRFEFSFEKFIKSKGKKEKKFFEAFQQSQMFERWSWELESVEKKIRNGVNISELGTFERKCSEKN